MGSLVFLRILVGSLVFPGDPWRILEGSLDFLRDPWTFPRDP
jgi:hypothetical protein